MLEKHFEDVLSRYPDLIEAGLKFIDQIFNRIRTRDPVLGKEIETAYATKSSKPTIGSKGRASTTLSPLCLKSLKQVRGRTPYFKRNGSFLPRLRVEGRSFGGKRPRQNTKHMGKERREATRIVAGAQGQRVASTTRISKGRFRTDRWSLMANRHSRKNGCLNCKILGTEKNKYNFEGTRKARENL